MEGGYGTMSADREKVVSTLVIEDVPSTSPDRAVSALVLENVNNQ